MSGLLFLMLADDKTLVFFGGVLIIALSLLMVAGGCMQIYEWWKRHKGTK